MRTSTTRATGYIVSLAAYLLLALVFHWPLPLHLFDALTAHVASDGGVYVWNQWVFRHEITAHGQLPLFTNEILALTPAVDLSLHNYTLFADALAYPLIPALGVVGAFNVIFLAISVLTAWTMFLLAKYLGARGTEAWLAGALFGFSPVLVARSTAHFSLAAAAALPLFVLLLLRTERNCSTGNAMALGATIAWATMCDAYFGVFCLLIGGSYLVARRWQVVFTPRGGDASHYLLNTLIALVTVIVTVIAITGGTVVSFGPVRLGLSSLYTPVLLLTILVTVRAGRYLRPSIRQIAPLATRAGVRAIVVAGATCSLMLGPMLYALAWRMRDGGEFHHATPWRNSPSGVDLLAFVTPNPNHLWFRTTWKPWMEQLAGGYIENVSTVTFIGLVVIAAALFRFRFKVPREWLALFVFFATLALGPFINVGGVNTFVPGPWAFFRYLPVVSAVRTPARFAIVAMLMFSVVFALALSHVTGRLRHLRTPVLAVTGLLLLVELAPMPRPLYNAAAPAVYQTIASDPREVSVLEIPFGFADGERSEGRFSGDAQFYQTIHQKPILSGALSRITDAELARQHAFPFVRALLALSQGDELPEDLREEAKADAGRLVRDARIGYIVMTSSTTPPALRAFAIESLQLRPVAEDGGRELFVPREMQPSFLAAQDAAGVDSDLFDECPR